MYVLQVVAHVLQCSALQCTEVLVYVNDLQILIGGDSMLGGAESPTREWPALSGSGGCATRDAHPRKGAVACISGAKTYLEAAKSGSVYEAGSCTGDNDTGYL